MAKTEPALNVPGYLLALIAVLFAIQGLQEYFSSETATDFVLSFGFIPGELSHWLGSDVYERIYSAANLSSNDQMLGAYAEIADYLKFHPSFLPWTMVSYAFLHGGWPHVTVNAVWLLAFGGLVARRLGPVRFAALFAISALGGALAHYAIHSDDMMPLVGASAAVSGITAAAVRFMFQPGAPLSGFALPLETLYPTPAQPLSRTFRDKRTLRFILLWLGINIATGLAGAPFGFGSGIIAWEAHIGGFFAGLLVFSFLDPAIRDPDLAG